MIAIGLILAAAQAASAPAAAPAAPLSTQQRFDAATKAGLEGRCAEAVTAFEALEPMPAVKRSPTVLGAVQLRKGQCLASLGRRAEAAVSLRAGIASLEGNADLRRDIAGGHADLGKIAYVDYDFAAARRHFLAALALLEGQEKFGVLLWLTRATMFDSGGEAVGYAGQALAQAAAIPDLQKQNLANVRTLHARALLNHGRAGDAYDELRKALKEQGGLTLQVDAGDIVTRSDLALAALLAKDPGGARQYLAYTGAGRLGKTPFNTAVAMNPPPCGGAADIRPEDVAVVEFDIRDDGSVGQATPIYASRNGPMAVEFAQAVRDWSWRPEDLQSIPPFFRVMTRVELRCSTAAERPDAFDALSDETEAWLEAQGVAPFAGEELSEAQRVAPARAELAARRARGGGLALLPPLLSLADNQVVPGVERARHGQEALDILTAARGPAAAIAMAAILSLTEDAGSIDAVTEVRRRHREFMRQLLTRADVAAEPRTGAALRLLIVRDYFRVPPPADAPDLLQQVVDDSRLAAGDPLRLIALLQLATLEARAGRQDAARARYQQTGLTAQQCSLVDVKPALRKTGVGSNDFPMEAMRWGFEGWVRTEFDIGADGRTAGSRAIIAYPPFVFRDAALGIIKDVRYEQSYRPEGGAGCGGAQENIKFEIPG